MRHSTLGERGREGDFMQGTFRVVFCEEHDSNVVGATVTVVDSLKNIPVLADNEAPEPERSVV